MGRGVLAVAVVAAVLCAGGWATARTWHVIKDGSGDFIVIQEAVNAAASGDTVRIGPGRFLDHAPFGPWPYDTYVGVTPSVLTLIGSGPDQTIIGPPASPGEASREVTLGICALSNVSAVRIESLAMENVSVGLYRSGNGATAFLHGRAERVGDGVVSWSTGGTLVEDCTFATCEYGVLTFSPARDITVRRCTFACEGGTHFQSTANGNVYDCTYVGGVVGAKWTDGSSGSIHNSHLSGMEHVAVVSSSGSHLYIAGCRLFDGAVNLLASGVQTQGERNVFGGATLGSVMISHGTVTLHSNHIVRGSGPSVCVNNYLEPPVVTLDLTGNYWGTASADTIAAWIVDGHDDPSVYAVVEFEPFSAVPVTEARSSMGGVKSLFRGRR